MRIIGGSLKGRRVELASDKARPTSDKVREALFSILYDRVEEGSFLDLFAGSGCVGMEALSRGASRAVFCDRDPKAIGAIRSNLKKFQIPPESYDCHIAPFESALAKCRAQGESFDLIYLDPPYDAGYYEKALTLCQAILAPTGLVIAEHRRDTLLPDRIGDLVLDRSRRYGTQILSFYHREVEE